MALLGSTTVFINSRMAVRAGDVLQGQGAPNSFVPTGDEDVMVGDMGFGMATPSKIGAFAASMRDLREKWDGLSPKERVAKLQSAVNAAMPSSMPAVKVNPKQLDPDLSGQMSSNTWALDINSNLMAGSMDEAKMTELANTVYHEGRHAEQWYNVAQSRAAAGQSAAQIRRETGVPQRVANAATQDPAPRGTSEGEMGKAVDESVYGSRSGHREQTFDDMDNNKSGAYKNYRALPEEKDAWAQGDAAGLAYQKTAF
jgi:hypothetical protein